MYIKDSVSKYINNRLYHLIFLILILFFVYFKFLFIDSGVFLDEGVFIYKSWRVLEGDILYSQIGDMRTPGHYFYFFIPLMLIGKLINLSPENTVLLFREALMVLEIFVIYVIYRILDIVNNKKYVNILLIGTIVISPFVLGWSNYAITENIVLLPFFFSIFIFLRLLISKSFGCKMLTLLGIAVGMSILVRHLSIIFYVPMVLYVLLEFRKRIRLLTFFGLGVIIPFVPILIYLVSNGAFFDFVDSIFSGLSKNVEWMPPRTIDYRFDQYIKEPMILDPAISFVILLSAFSLYICVTERYIPKEKRIMSLTYLFVIIYIVYMFNNASYNTKYIIPLVYFSIIAFGCYYSCIKDGNFKTILIVILLILVVIQGINVVNSGYLEDPTYRDGYITPSLDDQANLSKEIRKYDVADKSWFVSHQIITPYLLQTDSYNHINIKSSQAFPSRSTLAHIFGSRDVNVIVLDPATKFHMSSKNWVNDTGSNISIQMRFRIIGKEANKNDGLYVYMDDGKNIVAIKIHTNTRYMSKDASKYYNNTAIFDRFVNKSDWTDLNISVTDLFNKRWNYTPAKFYSTIVLDADNGSSLIVDIDSIRIVDTKFDMVLLEENFDSTKSKIDIYGHSHIIDKVSYVRMQKECKTDKLRIGNVGNGILSYIYLNYNIVDKVPMREHQNGNKTIYSEILVRK